MFGDCNRFLVRTTGIEIANAASKLAPVEGVNLGLTLTPALANAGSCIGIRETLLFGPRKRILLNKDPLALVTFARATEANDDCLE